MMKDAIQSKNSHIVNNPVRVTLYLIAAIFFTETIVMLMLNSLPLLTVFKEALLDSSLLTIIIIPMLYHLVYKPYRLHPTLRKKQEDVLFTISLTDELTGLYNRRGFLHLAEHQFKLANRKKQKVYMMYLDVDNFKEINDSFGHDEGDNVLIDIANMLKQNHRKSDIIARVGGDEFVVLPIRSSEKRINITIERLKKKLDTYIAHNGNIYNLSVSIGIAYYDPKSPFSISDLLNGADKQIYKEKRNKVNTPLL